MSPLTSCWVFVLQWFDTLVDPFSPMSQLCSLLLRQAALMKYSGTGTLGGGRSGQELIVLDSGSPPEGGAQGSGGAVGSCGWIPLGRGPWAPAGAVLDPEPGSRTCVVV